MRGFAVILAVAATASWTAALAQTTPNVVTPTPGLSTPLTFTTTNCMMSCNSRAANCQTGCFVPPPPVNAPGPAPNLNPATGTGTVILEHISKLGVPFGLHVNSTCLPERMCAELTFPLAIDGNANWVKPLKGHSRCDYAEMFAIERVLRYAKFERCPPFPDTPRRPNSLGPTS